MATQENSKQSTFEALSKHSRSTLEAVPGLPYLVGDLFSCLYCAAREELRPVEVLGDGLADGELGGALAHLGQVGAGEALRERARERAREWRGVAVGKDAGVTNEGGTWEV